MAKSLKGTDKTEACIAEEPAVDIVIRGNAASKAKMTNVINEMCKSNAGYAILEAAADMCYELKFDKQAAKEGLYGYADPCEECCVLSPKNTLAQNIVTLAHELRHAYQFTYEKLDDLGYTESDTRTMLLKNRTMEADAESYGCLVAWELKEQGNDLCWQDFSKDFPEIAQPFEKTLAETGDVNQARTAAFKGWYDNAERRDSYDRSVVASIEDVAPEVFKKKLKSVGAAKFVNAYCSDPDTGDNYFTEDPKMLETGKYTALYEDMKDRITAHHQKRDALPGRVPDKTIAGLETQKRSAPETENNAKAVSAQAKEIALAARQKRAAAQIRQQKKPALTAVLLQKKGNGR